jgi:hypothetical protein
MGEHAIHLIDIHTPIANYKCDNNHVKIFRSQLTIYSFFRN